MRTDPDAVHNLASDAARREQKERLRDRLFAELKQQGDPRMFGEGHVFDEYPHANPAHRHFYERYMKGEKLKAGWVNPTDFETHPLN